jgi:hypothetical protein
VDFPLAGVIHEIGVEAPSAPKRQSEERGQQRAGKGGEEKIEGKDHVVGMTNDQIRMTKE